MMTEEQLRTVLSARAQGDSDFRARLIEDPKSAIEREMDITIPDEFSFEVHEETGTAYHIVLPPPSRLGEGDLSEVAAGVGDMTVDTSEWTRT